MPNAACENRSVPFSIRVPASKVAEDSCNSRQHQTDFKKKSVI
jgi:hypothetical protein